MYLSRHSGESGPRWAVDGRGLPASFSLDLLLQLPADIAPEIVASMATEPETLDGPLLAPIEAHHEVWAGGVTYLKSREARQAESSATGGGDFYARVYDAERPELFFKAVGWRVIDPEAAIRKRRDAVWTVPEPELVLVLNSRLEIVGYCAGNDVSSRDIEGDNALYLPQAKVYDGSCALGPGIVTASADEVSAVRVALEIVRKGATIFSDTTNTSQMKRTPGELVHHLGSEMSWPQGVYLMTGTSIVPPEDYSLQPDDVVRITVGSLELNNIVGRDPAPA
ncbi:MAG: fumarylacetoacetate hydrolase family protein [Actinobacteria bacterium]|nr:fumarylacetoacetate hydrolase family protein [Actinomycetota bacterium]